MAWDWTNLAQALFADDFVLEQEGHILHGTADVAGQTIALIGTCEHTDIGVDIALRQARLVLDVVRDHPQRTILLLVDTQGQRLRHRDEMLGINSYMAHLGKCMELARLRGHKVLALVYDQALSGGFLSSGMMADACYAVPDAQIRVMALPAMARITKVPEPLLQALAQENPVFAPGAENYWKMGGVAAIWEHAEHAEHGGHREHGSERNVAQPLAQTLIQALNEQALNEAQPVDRRAQLGAERGGRKLAYGVIQQVVSNTERGASC
jgi:malonate decarboxylase gamma subunit